MSYRLSYARLSIQVQKVQGFIMSKSFPNFINFGVVLAAGSVLVACSGGTNKLPVLNDEVVSAAGGYVNISRTRGARTEKVKKLVIPAFNVTYKLKVDGTAVTISRDRDKEVMNSTNMKVNMEEADLAMMQRLTNKAYNAFVDELKNAKFEVVALADVSKSDAYYQLNHK
ncbi:MAG: hypothetical protein OQK32_02785, partial [Gammaproteobacteria bacterium]|nr:hypothetical protein [Gammaproteobacteria bacterium]